ncbi:hypothetical protein ASF55_14840 [Methylobacterium sp. Leaf119]|nr:hypothetical protein ASF55_14840 [Methylobacterium sp. Leaf119]
MAAPITHLCQTGILFNGRLLRTLIGDSFNDDERELTVIMRKMVKLMLEWQLRMPARDHRDV